MKIYIVGAGPFNEKFLTQKACEVIENSDLILTTSHFEKWDFIKDKLQKTLSINEICEFLQTNSDFATICVLASGDVGFYSIANTIKNRLGKGYDIEFVSGISSFQYLTSKLMLPYEKIKLLSLHGKSLNIVANVCYNEFVFCLTGGENSPKNIIKTLYSSGLRGLEITIGQNLSYPNEQIFTDKIENLIGQDFDGLCALLIENKNFTKHYKQISDEDFVRGKVPMTKQIIRDSAVSLMDISPSDVVYDVGAGTGSVSIVMAKKAFESIVFAIEKKAEAVELIKENIEKFGTYNIEIIENTAPFGMENLPPPTKVFIGGSTGNLKEIVALILSKNDTADIIITAVTLQTLTETLAVFEEFSLIPQIFNVTVAKSQKLGRYDLMTGENPVYIIKSTPKG